MAKTKYYVVWKGRKTGIFSTWEECSAQVNSFAGAEYKSFETRAAAEAAQAAGYAANKGKPAAPAARVFSGMINPPLMESFSVDASCIGNPGVLEYHGVNTATGEEFFHQGPFENGTNNIGEFLAIVHALAYCKQRGLTTPIYSDSETGLTWVRKKHTKTLLEKDSGNRVLFELIRRAETWLATNTYENPLLKWDTEAWGEIPADYGRK
jgi:ribonuclease HI